MYSAPRSWGGATFLDTSGRRLALAGREEPMGGAPVVILLVGLLVPITTLILAALLDAVVLLWVIYRLWHDEWSVSLGRLVHGLAHVPHWRGRLIRTH
jgi:hypothetical protein